MFEILSPRVAECEVGDIVELDEDRAGFLVRAGLARPVPAPPKKKAAPQKAAAPVVASDEEGDG